jgi:hypothetical protein
MSTATGRGDAETRSATRVTTRRAGASDRLVTTDYVHLG